MKKTLVIHFARYGPYHFARLMAAVEVLEPLGWQVFALETAGSDATYAWNQPKKGEFPLQVITAFPKRVHEEVTVAECQRVLPPLLTEIQPDAVAIAGWASKDARVCLDWCRQHGVISIVMSETREIDGRRVWWKEWLKSKSIRRFAAALVGGNSHRDYLVKLGMLPKQICCGYNVVNNAYFREESCNWRVNDHEKALSITPYLLASNRFVERKNLIRLLQAFAGVVPADSVDPADSTEHGAPIDLCLVGDGPHRAALRSTCAALDLPVVEAAPWDMEAQVSSVPTRPRVFLPGFRQIEELPRFYAHACCFVHPAISEPWGLVINEAMACGLPVLCSANCGAAEELLINGVNGFSFDPLNTESISRVLSSFLNLPPEQKAAMGEASAELVEQRVPTAAFGQGLAALLSGCRQP